MTASCPKLEELIAYQAGELDAAAEERLEEHLFSCVPCAARLEDLYRLRAAVIDATGRGAFTSGATAELVDRASAAGVQIRSYRLEPGDTAPCTCSPTDHFVAVRLAAPLAGAERVDMDVETRFADSGEIESHRREQLAIDHETGEVIVLYAGDAIRAAPRTRWTMHLRARGPAGERVLGPFVLEHTPWDEIG